ncbi:hypothetical protein C4D60_Mb04t29560 [Musa balbisiana]|uniref:Uncharacterized protein n=1 Tax=Musa balbisiana TaxID=52838 RepID=A0A4S8KFP8_MUSBA|nr:hypothetical protein C4D60_Mb04t29560 [Musa balbisiana]
MVGAHPYLVDHMARACPYNFHHHHNVQGHHSRIYHCHHHVVHPCHSHCLLALPLDHSLHSSIANIKRWWAPTPTWSIIWPGPVPITSTTIITCRAPLPYLSLPPPRGPSLS